MGMKVYAVKECGQIRGAMFSLQIGVYSTLEKAQKRMNSCFATAMESLKKMMRYLSSLGSKTLWKQRLYIVMWAKAKLATTLQLLMRE